MSSDESLVDLIPTDYKNKIEAEAAAFTEPVKVEEKQEYDRSRPRIKLTSFEGSKGLSAQHVFVVGLHETECPRDAMNIDDLEVCRFIVALTRTRKECHLLHTGMFSGKSPCANNP